MSRREFEHGLVIGRFIPPHAGHEYVIRTALLHCRRVTVLVLARSDESLPMTRRAQWLRECFPNAETLRVVAALDDLPNDFADPALWSAHVDLMRRALASDAHERGESPAPVDAVFSSEPYGRELARRFDAHHVCLDPARALHPVSGSLVRADLPGHWTRLPPSVCAGLAMRVVVVGAESTGTTTLARDLCAALRTRGGVWERTAWVPEYGREYSVNLLAVARAHDPAATPMDIRWTEDDFLHIAAEQTRREDMFAREGSPVLVCDTDALATCVWHERYLERWSERLAAIAAAMPPRALYLLTDHDRVAFEDDGLRDGEHLRPWMTERFKQVLDGSAVPWRLVSGSASERLDAALGYVEEARMSWGKMLG